MRRPQDLSRETLIEIVAALQQRLYLDVDQSQFIWNPDKDWSSADALMELSDVLAGHGLAPDAILPFTHDS